MKKRIRSFFIGSTDNGKQKIRILSTISSFKSILHWIFFSRSNDVEPIFSRSNTSTNLSTFSIVDTILSDQRRYLRINWWSKTSENERIRDKRTFSFFRLVKTNSFRLCSERIGPTCEWNRSKQFVFKITRKKSIRNEKSKLNERFRLGILEKNGRFGSFGHYGAR